MAHQLILIVEDEEEIRELVRYNLERQGYRVATAASGEEAMRAVHEEPPNLVLLDLMLPAMDGWEVCKQLKREPTTQQIPVIMLTAKGEESDMVLGLELGADDYISKPFSPRVLTARVHAVLRRKASAAEEETGVIRLHDIVIHPGRHEVRVGDEPISLTATEFKVLKVLAERPGWVFTRYQIANLVHGGDSIVTDRSVDVQIVGLRKKLGAAGEYVETIRGVGYRFKE
jgi:two-component system, OmpR family, alkaline phosphatase synthesis response regulator PhoP